LTEEKTAVGCLCEVKAGSYFAALYAPTNDSGLGFMLFDSAYGWGEGPTADDAVHEARNKLWNGL
jgi:hypothetical protein